MFSPIIRTVLLAAVVLAFGSNPVASTAAEDVLFVTNVGDIIVRVNPTDDPNLDALADNFLLYVTSGRYDNTVINRAATDFVIQMGIFNSVDQRADATVPGDFTPIDTFDPVIVDSDDNGTVDFPFGSNTRGTISLALNASGPNSGTSSFFINLRDNSGLDSQGFVPFAIVNDLTTVDLINALPRESIDSSLTFRDTPVVDTDSSGMVNILSARIIPEPTGVMISLIACTMMTAFRGRCQASV